MGDVSPQAAHLADDAGGQVHIPGAGGEEDGFALRQELVVGEGHLELVLKIRNGPQPLDDGTGPRPLDVAYQQTAVAVHLDIFKARFLHHPAYHLHPLLGGEKALFLLVHRHQHNHLVKDAAGPLDDIQVTICNGVEAAGAHHRFHSSPSPSSGLR